MNMNMNIKRTIKLIMRSFNFFFIKRSRMSLEDAKATINEYSPKPYGRINCKNSINIIVDLQIIVPVYNSELYIKECLLSILTQKTQYSFIVTIINDGSLDQSKEIIESLAVQYPGKIEMIDQENRGYSGARNAGLKTLKGKYIMFLDSDDLLEKNAIERLVSLSILHDNDITQGKYTKFDEIACWTENDFPSGFPWGKVFKASVLKNFQFPDGYLFEDTPISFILYGMNLKMENINDFVYRYRMNPNGITAMSPKYKNSVDSYYITELCLEEFPEYNVKYDQRAYEYFLKQCIKNWERTKHRPRKIREAIFILEFGLMERYFDGMSSKENKNIEIALRNKQFSRFEILAVTK